MSDASGWEEAGRRMAIIKGADNALAHVMKVVEPWNLEGVRADLGASADGGISGEQHEAIASLAWECMGQLITAIARCRAEYQVTQEFLNSQRRRGDDG